METVNYGLSPEDYVVVEQAIKENDLAVLSQFTFSGDEVDSLIEAHKDRKEIYIKKDTVDGPFYITAISDKVDYPVNLEMSVDKEKVIGIFTDGLPKTPKFTPTDVLNHLKTLPLEGQVSFMNDLKANLLKEWQERKSVLEKDSEALTERLNEATDAIKTFA